MRKYFERGIGSWLSVCTALLLISPNAHLSKNNFHYVPIYLLLIGVALAFLTMTVLYRFTKNSAWDTLLMTLSACAFSVLCAFHCAQVFTSLACILICVVCIRYALWRGVVPSVRDIGKRTAAVLVGILIFGIFAFVAAVGVMRYITYSTPTFDFGIFAQMFYYMKETLLPMTTCERNHGLLSHFAVHISPIYYLILPLYMLFPYAPTLNVAQALIVSVSIIPVYLLCRRKGFSRIATVLLCGVTAFLPALSGGTLYDIHENCFLLPLLLFVFYFYESKKNIPMYLCAFLVLMVKEDAALYIAIFALYILLQDKQWKKGLILLASSVAYFVLAMYLLNTYGDGSMTSRFADYMQNDSLFSMITTLLRNPGLVLANAFAAKKIEFIVLMLAPLCFLPLVTKKLPRFLMLAPMLVINLMPDWEYQYNIGFQYVFGSAAFLLYASILNLSEIEREKQKQWILSAVTASVLLFGAHIAKGCQGYVRTYRNDQERLTTYNEALELIEDDASVCATRFMLPHLSNRMELYCMINTKAETDYAVISLYEPLAVDYYRIYSDMGYQEIYNDGELLAILKHPDADS